MNCNEQCCICLEEKILMETKCKHKFCNNCITEWTNKNNNCPLCRESINQKNINKKNLNIVIRRFPRELKIYGMTVTPSKYLGTFFEMCINEYHNIRIRKPFGVILVCDTCNKSKSYNWIN